MKVLSIPQNLVMVRADDDFKNWNVKGVDGQELMIPVGPASKNDPMESEKMREDRQAQSDWDRAQHTSITGEVMMLPDRLVYHGERIRQAITNYGVSIDIAADISELRLHSTSYDVPMELQVGDKVYYKYIEQFNCIKENRFVDYGDTKFYLMNYDCITMAIRDGRPIMVNGNILIEPVTDKTKADKLASAFSQIGANGLLTPLKKEKKSRKIQFGTVKYAGAICNGYLDDHEEEDDKNIQVGDIVAFDPRIGISLEHEYHRLFDEERLIRMQRKEVLMVLGKNIDLGKFKF